MSYKNPDKLKKKKNAVKKVTQKPRESTNTSLGKKPKDKSY